MIPLYARVNSEFKLDVGTLVRNAEVLRIHQPQRSMFDQLCAYLLAVELPEQRPRDVSSWVIGIGTTALCLRWGTYLALLWDSDKPIDPRVHDPDASLIDDGEMARINIEASSNLAKLLTLQHDYPDEYDRLIWAAYTLLPMPWRKVKPARDLPVRMLQSAISMPAALIEPVLANVTLPEEVDEHPMRACANVLINSFWRNNSPVESLHAGRGDVYSLTHRRAAPNQVNSVLRFVSERLSTMLGGRPLWEKPSSDDPSLPWPTCVRALYAIPLSGPAGWSFTESCREVLLSLDHRERAPAQYPTSNSMSASIN